MCSTSKSIVSFVALFACLLLAVPAAAALTLGGNSVSVSGNIVTFKVAETRVGYDLKVTGPDGYLHEERFEDGNAMSWVALGVDGNYMYELVPVAAARDRGTDLADSTPVAETLSGSFRLQAGRFANPERPERLEKDIVHPDDVIIQFSLCVGNDCVNGESFGFDTLRLKENNLRIHFQDTSSSASFPSNDWRLVANDSSNGGGNYLAIEDSTAGRQIFRVDAGAPANALRVDSGGDVGIGTSNPVVELHVVDGDSPTLRLEQDGSSGFTPQTFDLVANEANFFIRDVTNGSQLPFRIVPGADTNALFINSNNDIGIGTNSPGEDVHIRKTGTTELRIEQAGTASDDAIIRMVNNSTAGAAGAAWVFSHRGPNAQFLINYTGVGGNEFVLDTAGNMTISGGLVTGTAGSCDAGTPCDGVFHPDFVVPSIEDHAASMWQNSYLPAVGPTLPNQPINITKKTTAILNELEHAHIYIEQLHETLKQLQSRVDQLEAQAAE